MSCNVNMEEGLSSYHGKMKNHVTAYWDRFDFLRLVKTKSRKSRIFWGKSYNKRHYVSL